MKEDSRKQANPLGGKKKVKSYDQIHSSGSRDTLSLSLGGDQLCIFTTFLKS